MIEKPTSGCINDRIYYEDVPEMKETKFTIRFMMTPEQAIVFMDEMLDRGAFKIRAETNGNITFIETPLSLYEVTPDAQTSRPQV
jgi:hypothetical protein